MIVERRWRIGLRVVALGWFLLLLLAPVGLVFYRTFEHGVGAVIDSITTPAAVSAFWLTIEVTAIAVPLNAIVGVLMALALARGRFRGKALLNGLLDLPFAISPVVIGLSLVLLYGRTGWFGPWLADHGHPDHLLGPRHRPRHDLRVAPVRRPRGDARVARDRRRAGAGGLDARRGRMDDVPARSRCPAIRWGLAYGIVLSVARAIGEFGAVSVVSGRVAGETMTLTLLVQQRFENFDLAGAYAASTLLAVIALLTLLLMTRINPRREEHDS